MNLWTGLTLYAVTALSLAWTSYVMIFRPSIHLFEEITEQTNSIYSGKSGFIIWTIFAFITAPWVAWTLLKNDNRNYIEDFAISLAEQENDE